MKQKTEEVKEEYKSPFELPTNKTETQILQQISTEYRMGYDYVAPRRLEAQNRYKLYSNQNKSKELVSDTTLFSIFQSVLSQLYDDRLNTVLEPSHADDTDKVDALNPVLKYDAIKMEKEVLDFDWDWYTCFWGSGFVDVSAFDPETLLMKPSVVNNATLIMDPWGNLVNGDQRGFGAWRFWGREIAKTKLAMKDEGFKNYEGLNPAPDYTSLAYVDKNYRNIAQNTATPAVPVAYENDLIPLLEWFTHINGEKWIVYTDLQFTKICKIKKLKEKIWPLVQRKLFPIPNDPLGVSIPDLVEDKQRARSILTNLGLNMAKADLYPMYVYDRNLISPTSDLSFGFNKWIPADGNPSQGVQPLQKPAAGVIVSYIMDLLSQSAERATAANSMAQGAQSEKSRSANEMVRVFDKANQRTSTSAKVFGWSEKEFWRWWLRNNQRYLTKLHKKSVRIDGPFGPKFQVYTGDDFKLTETPDFTIESKILMEAKDQDAKQDAIAYQNMTMNDQTINRRYMNRRNARLFGYTADQVNRLFPPTPDELIAEAENVKLLRNQIPKISINDDHQTHLLVHAKAQDTPAAIVHIEAHKKAIMMKREANAALGTPAASPAENPTSGNQNPNPQGVGTAPGAQPGAANSVQQ